MTTDGRGSVIHDIGYRPYRGPRQGRWGIVAGLLRHGALSTFGFGRSGKAKVLPFALLFMTLVPALVLVGIVSFLGFSSELLDYAGYQQTTSFFVILFVAAQAPVLFTRDLRSGVISLYLARPLGSATFALVRWASLVLAILAFVITPLVLMFIGGLAAGADFTEELPRWLVAMAGAVLLAILLATVGAVVSSLTLRRGLAIGGSIVVLLFGLGMTAVLQEVANEQGQQGIATWLGLLSPFVLVDAAQHGLADAPSAFEAPPEDSLTALAMLLVALGLAALGLLLLVRRYRNRGAR
ncbi:ABC transporter permease [Ornithinimicrobium pratense]|uniref:ABC transporter permease n=1 Tax=Ornithinimicrobium pratense TaxID=2593973 RepID=A0A5J6V7M2_9MICO|nr:ABC transporter permease [Ornithinimicrobium pratense]QFG69344.1 ABC transporter permease [Ornithinimicrobium pratense]